MAGNTISLRESIKEDIIGKRKSMTESKTESIVGRKAKTSMPATSLRIKIFLNMLFPFKLGQALPYVKAFLFMEATGKLARS